MRFVRALVLVWLALWGCLAVAQTVPVCSGAAIWMGASLPGQYASLSAYCAGFTTLGFGPSSVAAGGCLVEDTVAGLFVDNTAQDVCASGSFAVAPQSGVVVPLPDVLQISPEGGALIAGAVLAVWALGWGIRALIRALDSDRGSSSSSSSESDS